MSISNSLATNCKPTLGYATKGAAIAALRSEGRTWGEIGQMLGMNPRAASAQHVKTQQRVTRSIRTVALQGNVFLDLEREARRRNITPDALAASLLTVIITDKLFTAVLDDNLTR